MTPEVKIKTTKRLINNSKTKGKFKNALPEITLDDDTVLNKLILLTKLSFNKFTSLSDKILKNLWLR